MQLGYWCIVLWHRNSLYPKILQDWWPSGSPRTMPGIGITSMVGRSTSHTTNANGKGISGKRFKNDPWNHMESMYCSGISQTVAASKATATPLHWWKALDTDTALHRLNDRKRARFAKKTKNTAFGHPISKK